MIDPTMHGEITAIRHCTDILRERGWSAQKILQSWKDFSLYTNGEPCPMCASAIRWAGFKEVIYGSSIKTIAESKLDAEPGTRADLVDGRNQIYIPSALIWEKSYSLGHATLLYVGVRAIEADTRLGNVLTNETDVFFSHQFNESAPCRESSVGVIPLTYLLISSHRM